MFTQCPECDVAFRVTAEVLRQAAGKVRCGGCGIAFNALDYLSENLPPTATNPEPEPQQAPELESDSPAEFEAGTPPQSISAEQSAALLKTLDQLAGEDVRIEDTGIEWRVLNVQDDESDNSIDEQSDEKRSPTDTGSLNFVLQDDDDDIDSVSIVGVDDIDDGPDVSDYREESGLAPASEEMRFDDNTPLPDDFDLSAIRSFTPEAEPQPSPAEMSALPDDSQVDLALGDPDEWEDLLGEVNEGAVPVAEADELEIKAAEETVAESEAADDGLPDVDTQFAIQAEAMGIDLSGMHSVNKDETDDSEADESQDEPRQLADETLADIDELDRSIDEDLIAAAFETEATTRAELMALDEEDEDEQAEEDMDIFDESALDRAADLAELDTVLQGLDDDAAEDEIEDDEPEAEDVAAEADFDLPEQSEEEMTLNMMIDQDLLAQAVEDEDGFTSTIVQNQFSENDIHIDGPKPNPFVETIVMEGDFVRAELARESATIENELRASGLHDMGFAQQARETIGRAIRGGRRKTDPPSYGMIVGNVVLAIVLVLQAVHQSREALATVPVFENTVVPLYRIIGKPVTPAWDIKGWRFEATKGSMDETDQLLTIYSRVGNTSEQALPYPLIHVSLTDRFEEIIGSRVLEPTEYLVGNSNPRRSVAPGNTFNALISIASPTPDATGFKLNVCYRLSSGQLRCSIDDFK